MSCGWAKASACHLQVSLSCAVLCHIVSLQNLSRSSLHHLADLQCRIFLSYGLQVVTCEVHRPAQDHLILLTFLITSMTFVLSRKQMLVFLSLYVCWAYFITFWSVWPHVCSVLVWSVSSSLHHYVIAGSSQELYNCLFSGRWQGCFWRYPGVWRMPPSLPWFFVVSLCPGSFPWGCSVVPSTSSLQHFLSAHCSRLFGCCLQPSPLSLRCSS